MQTGYINSPGCQKKVGGQTRIRPPNFCGILPTFTLPAVAAGQAPGLHHGIVAIARWARGAEVWNLIVQVFLGGLLPELRHDFIGRPIVAMLFDLGPDGRDDTGAEAVAPLESP